jgi:hypothetical protein
MIHQALLNAIPPGDTPIVVYNQTLKKNRLEELGVVVSVHAASDPRIAGTNVRPLESVETDYDFYVALGFRNRPQTPILLPSESVRSYSLKKICRF